MTKPAGVGDGDHLPVSAYYDLERVGSPAVSPSGDRVAFTLTEHDADDEEAVTSLFVAPTDGSREPHRLTRLASASSPTWSPDGSKLAFLAARDADTELRGATSKDDEDEAESEDGEADGERDEAESADDGDDEDDEETTHGEEERQVFVFDLELGGDPRQVTTREHGVDELDWGPDGERLVVSAPDPTEEQAEYLEAREDGGPIEVERVQHKANGHGWTDEARNHLFVVDVATRELERIDEAYSEGARAAMSGDGLDPRWGPGDRIAFATYQRDGADETWAVDVHTIAPDGSDHRVLTDGAVAAGGVAWHPDGEHLAYAVSDPEDNYETGSIVVGADDPNADVRHLSKDLELPEWRADWVGEDALLVAVGDGGQTVLHRVDATTGDREQVFPTREEDLMGARYGMVDVAADARTAAFGLTGPDELELAALSIPAAGDGAVAAEPASDDRLVRVTETNEGVREAVSVDVERVAFQSETGVTVDGLAYHGADFDFDAYDYPVIVDIHGGPTVYDQPTFKFQYHHWVAQGYVVLNVNYRGSTSFGYEFASAISGDWGPREARDVEAGVGHLVQRGWVDPERVFVTGFSQGGVNTAFVLAYTDVATAGAAEHGIYDFYSSYGTDDCHVWWDDEFGQPWEDPQAYYDVSSITKVDEIEDPLLLTAGEDDWRCPPTQAEQMYVSVKKQGVDAKLVVYPEIPHSYGPPETATHRLETVTEWFREHDPAIETDEEDGGETATDEAASRGEGNQ